MAFATTRWSLILAAGERSDRALEELCATYWPPLYAYARRAGHDPERAADLTQAFFAALLDGRALAAADPTRGRFRSFLLTSMKNFIAGEWRKAHAEKRGGAVETLSLDFDAAEQSYALEPAGQLTPEAIYERQWALGVLSQAIAKLRAIYEAEGKVELFDGLKDYLGGEAEAPYAELSRRLGRSEGSLRTAATRMRARWQGELRTLIAETVGRPDEVEDELRLLIRALGV